MVAVADEMKYDNILCAIRMLEHAGGYLSEAGEVVLVDQLADVIVGLWDKVDLMVGQMDAGPTGILGLAGQVPQATSSWSGLAGQVGETSDVWSRWSGDEFIGQDSVVLV